LPADSSHAWIGAVAQISWLDVVMARSFPAIQTIMAIMELMRKAHFAEHYLRKAHTISSS
jgi:energy-converting hydrogenase Eha subunit C